MILSCKRLCSKEFFFSTTMETYFMAHEKQSFKVVENEKNFNTIYNDFVWKK